jgi:hypothetical protein
VTFVAAFASVTQPVRAALRAGSLQPMRESVELTRPTLDPDAPENRRITTASFQRAPTYYDPLVIELESVRELRDLMRAADERGTPLFVNYGRPELAERRTPELVELVHDPALFERVAELRGFEPRGLRYVYRYKGAAGPRTGAAR